MDDVMGRYMRRLQHTSPAKKKRKPRPTAPSPYKQPRPEPVASPTSSVHHTPVSLSSRGSVAEAVLADHVAYGGQHDWTLRFKSHARAHPLPEGLGSQLRASVMADYQVTALPPLAPPTLRSRQLADDHDDEEHEDHGVEDIPPPSPSPTTAQSTELQNLASSQRASAASFTSPSAVLRVQEQQRPESSNPDPYSILYYYFTSGWPTPGRFPHPAGRYIYAFANLFMASFAARARSRRSPELAQELLDEATADIRQFLHALQHMLIEAHPTVFQWPGASALGIALPEILLPRIFRLVFVLYRRRHGTQDGQLYEKMRALQHVSTRDLGVSEKFSLIDASSHSDSLTQVASSPPVNQSRWRSAPSSSPLATALGASRASPPELSLSSSPPISSSLPRAMFALGYEADSVSSGDRPLEEPDSESAEFAEEDDANTSATRIEFSQSTTSSSNSNSSHPARLSMSTPSSPVRPYTRSRNRPIKRSSHAAPSSSPASRFSDKFNLSVSVPSEKPSSSDEHCDGRCPASPTTMTPCCRDHAQQFRDRLAESPRAAVITESLISTLHSSPKLSLVPLDDTDDENKEAAPIALESLMDEALEAGRRDIEQRQQTQQQASPQAERAPLPGNPFQAAIDTFSTITSVVTPFRKAQVMVATSQKICDCVDAWYTAKCGEPERKKERCIGADDLLSLYSYVLIKSNVPFVLSQLAYMDDFLPEGVKLGSAGYHLATLQAAVELISGLDVPRHS